PVDVDGEERVVLVHEVTRDAARALDVPALTGALRRALAEEHDLRPHAIVLIPTLTLPPPPSGQVRGRAGRARFLAGELDVLGEWRAPVPAEAPAPVPAAGGERTARKTAREIAAFLRAAIAGRTGLPDAEIDDREPFVAFGLDSVQ